MSTVQDFCSLWQTGLEVSLEIQFSRPKLASSLFFSEHFNVQITTATFFHVQTSFKPEYLCTFYSLAFVAWPIPLAYELMMATTIPLISPLWGMDSHICKKLLIKGLIEGWVGIFVYLPLMFPLHSPFYNYCSLLYSRIQLYFSFAKTHSTYAGHRKENGVFLSHPACTRASSS